MIINIPIEPIPMRYSCDWDEWFKTEFEKEELCVKTIHGKSIVDGIEEGRFLDCIGTNYYKSSQLQKIIFLIQNKMITSGDILFFHDLWFPGIEQIKYIADTLKIDLKFAGCLHAGAYDPNDLLYQANTGNWAIHFEHMLFALVDLIFVATHYHRELLIRSRSFDYSKIKVTGFPIYPKRGLTSIDSLNEKENFIVFPHRRDPEKNPHVFDELQTIIPLKYCDWKFISTALHHFETKQDYYRLLEKSKIAVSFSDQETWGIAMQEAVFSGCLPLVPNKLSYAEMYLDVFKYNTFPDFTRKLEKMMNDPLKYECDLRDQQQLFCDTGTISILNIIRYLEEI